MPGVYPDILHSYLAISGLCMMGLDKELEQIDPILNLPLKVSKTKCLEIQNLKDWLLNKN